MLIGELVRRTGFSRDTIRYYEKRGLIRLDRRQRLDNNYKDYDESVVQRLLLIRQLKTFGFTLRETRELLDLDAHDLLNCKTVGEMVQLKLTAIQEKIEALNGFKNKLHRVMEVCEGDCKTTIQVID